MNSLTMYNVMMMEKIKKDIAAAQVAVGNDLIQDAKDDAPVRTGNMRDKTEVGKTSIDGTHINTRLVSLAEYANYVDKGTETQAANGFFTRNVIIPAQTGITGLVESKLKEI